MHLCRILFVAVLILEAGMGLYGQGQGRATVAENAPVTLLPDAARTPLRVLPQGTSLIVLKDQGEWLEVQFSDAPIRYPHGVCSRTTRAADRHSGRGACRFSVGACVTGHLRADASNGLTDSTF